MVLVVVPVVKERFCITVVLSTVGYLNVVVPVVKEPLPSDSIGGRISTWSD